MTTVRSVVHPGWIEVTGPGVHAVVAAAERHVEVLTSAAEGGVVGLLEALTAHGLGGAPDLAAVAVADGVVRVVVRGSASVVLGDGTRIGSDGRLPWRDVDVTESAAGDEVSVEAPEPEAPRGWRRPARLGRGAAVVAAAPVAVTPEDAVPEDETRTPRDQLDEVGTAEDAAPAPDLVEDVVPEDEPRTARDLLVDVGADEGDPVVVEDVVPEDEPRTPRDLLVDVGAGEGEVAADEGDPVVVEDVVPEDEPRTPRDQLDEVGPGEDAAPVQHDLTLPPPDEASAGLPPAARVPVTPPPKGGLIESVPWRRGAAAEAAPAGTPRTAELPVHTPPPPPPAEAEVAPPAADEARPVPEPQRPEDTVHDLGPAAAPAEHRVPDEHAAPDVTTDRGALHRSDDDLDRPVVLAVLCPAGHPSPPHAGVCRSCGREIPPQQPFQTPRPSLGVLRISTGGVVPLDRGVLLGRAPRVNEELPPSQRPHLLRVGGADRDISRNHAEVVLEGWHVLVRDLGSTNGTTVTLPGQEPVRLRPTEDHGIEPGAVITLADEVSLTYEVDA